MSENLASLSFESWLGEVRTKFTGDAPDLLPLFETYAAEAIFGRRYIAADLAQLQAAAQVLEVGAGSLLLSCQLVREGFTVTALEPIGVGFSHFDRMRQVVMELAEASECLPRIVDSTAEAFSEAGRFAYAFSVNVMEHVNDVASVMRNIGRSLDDGASYRFTCANYLFPYEPHFNIPTLFSKKLTEKVMHRRIFNAGNMPDPTGTWKSLNWITVAQVASIARGLPGFRVEFNSKLLVETAERMVFDTEFAHRRSAAVRGLFGVLVRSRLHRALRFVPPVLQPLMDCRLRRAAHRESR
ncbi:Class I SAM-dependent methyltransferase [Pararobbsia alpina]|uniref:class I SAM-dependent methyltransferase n=1 Tax=Pararobbsia alpina TaxID=621374 RepID=UPI0039A52B8C